MHPLGYASSYTSNSCKRAISAFLTEHFNRKKKKDNLVGNLQGYNQERVSNSKARSDTETQEGIMGNTD